MTYAIQISDVAQAESDAAYLWISQFSPKRAGKWYDGLLAAIESLTEFPQSCPLARENDRFDRSIRQLLYGRGREVFRILFTITEPTSDDDEAVVRILH